MTENTTPEHYDTDPDDAILEVTAVELQIHDAAAYARGWELLQGFTALQHKIQDHYQQIRGPIQAAKKAQDAALKNLNRMEEADLKEPLAIKEQLAARLVAWKQAQDERDAAEQRALQAAEDQRAADAQAARLAAIEQARSTATIPAVQQSFAAEAHAVATTPPVSRAVALPRSVPKIAGGHTRRTWRAEVVDLRQLLTAYLAGAVTLNEQAIIDALQSSLNTQATALQQNLGASFPGVVARFTDTAVVKR